MPSLLIRAVVAGAFTLILTAALPPAAHAVPCGSIGTQCCPTGPPCTTGVCDGQNCVACGGSLQPCCDGALCDQGFDCAGGDFDTLIQGQGGAIPDPNSAICVPCGGADQRCCDESGCGDGLTCAPTPCQMYMEGQGGGAGRDLCTKETVDDPFTCQPCGGSGELCCDKTNCDSGFICTSECGQAIVGQGGGAWDCNEGQGGGAGGAPSTCEPCGGLGQSCCEDSTCNTDSLLCGGAFCEACGGLGEQCCSNSSCNDSGSLCLSDTCIGAAPAVGNGGFAMLILLLSGVALFGLRRVTSS